MTVKQAAKIKARVMAGEPVACQKWMQLHKFWKWEKDGCIVDNSTSVIRKVSQSA